MYDVSVARKSAPKPGHHRDKGGSWADNGCEVFSDVDGVFLMTPPDFDPEPDFPITSIKTSIVAAQPARVVFPSTVGAQVAEFNRLSPESAVNYRKGTKSTLSIIQGRG